MQEEIGEPKLNTGPEFESQESKIETGLPAEAVKAIMGKVQDINADGTAFSVLKGVFDSEPQNLGKVLESGLLGNPYQKRAKSVDRADWAKNVKEKKDAVVYFNILGRAEEQNLADTHYIGDPEGICVIFDTGSFAEQGKEDWENGRPIQKNRTFRRDDLGKRKFLRKGFGGEDVKTISLADAVPSVQGFTLSFRVAPRNFRGIAIKVAHHYSEAEVDQFIDQKKAMLGRTNRRYSPEDEASDRQAFLNERVNPGTAVDYRNEAEKIAELMMKKYKGREKLIVPIYDVSGNLLWPEQMAYDKVRELVVERDKKE